MNYRKVLFFSITTQDFKNNSEKIIGTYLVFLSYMTYLSELIPIDYYLFSIAAKFSDGETFH